MAIKTMDKIAQTIVALVAIVMAIGGLIQGLTEGPTDTFVSGMVTVIYVVIGWFLIRDVIKDT
jgi:uncharacterized membrane protein